MQSGVQAGMMDNSVITTSLAAVAVSPASGIGEARASHYIQHGFNLNPTGFQCYRGPKVLLYPLNIPDRSHCVSVNMIVGGDEPGKRRERR